MRNGARFFNSTGFQQQQCSLPVNFVGTFQDINEELSSRFNFSRSAASASGSVYDADKRLKEESHWAAILLLGGASFSSFAGYGSAHLYKFACRYICRSCTHKLYVENYIKTKQHKTKPDTSWTYIL